jgi:hypothetical protein
LAGVIFCLHKQSRTFAGLKNLKPAKKEAATIMVAASFFCFGHGHPPKEPY